MVLIDHLRIDLNQNIHNPLAHMGEAYSVEITPIVDYFAAQKPGQASDRDVDFDQILDAFPPLTHKCLLAEFDAGAAGDSEISRMGLVFFDWRLLANFCPEPWRERLGMLKRFEEGYGVYLIWQEPSGIKVHPALNLIGFNQEGRLIYWDLFMEQEPAHRHGKAWRQAKAQITSYLYLGLRSFASINSGEVDLRRISPNSWEADFPW